MISLRDPDRPGHEQNVLTPAKVRDVHSLLEVTDVSASLKLLQADPSIS